MKNEPMTVREALEITSRRWPNESEHWDRARAILDALVEAHEAYSAFDDIPLGQDHTTAIERHIAMFSRLRALERGEES